ncbi:MAG: flagellar motor switch protein FliN [Limnochordales bacterium]|nr:flagellar motor switch protein FliN [Limnochordales bacterium]
MAGGEWPPAVGTLPGLPDAAAYPAAFAELVAAEMKMVLRDVIEATVTVLPRGVTALPEPARESSDAPTWLGVEIELGWGKQSVHLLHLFAPSLPALLYRALTGPASQQGTEAGAGPHGEGANPDSGRSEGDPSSLGTSEALRKAGAASFSGVSGREEAAATLFDRGVLHTRSHLHSEERSGTASRATSRKGAGSAEVRDTSDPTSAPVLIRPVTFAPLEGAATSNDEVDNLELLMDVPLDITVELGRTSLSMREVLALGKGSILELDHMAGEPVDILVNGRLIAKGEVVVVDDTFGVKITAIVSPGERVREGGAGQGA